MNSRVTDGLLTSAAYGANLTQTRQYDPDTRRTIAVVATANVSPAPQTTMQVITYGYDQVGNVKERYDWIDAVDEKYNVDQLNRLSTVSKWNGDNPRTYTQTKAYQYDALGDITSKNDSGTYTYPPAGQPQPHAVSSVSNAIFGTANYISRGGYIPWNGPS